MKNSIVANIIQTLGTQIGSQLITILLGVVIARTIGPSGKGFMSYAIIIVSFVTIFCNGFSDAIYYQFGKKQQPANAVYTVAFRILKLVLIITIPILVAFALFIPSQRPLALAAVVLPFAIYIQFMTPFLMIREKVSFVNMRVIYQNVGTAALTIPLILFTHLGLLAVGGVWILFYAIAAIQSASGIKPIIKENISVLLDDKETAATRTSLMREQLQFGIRASGASVAGFANLRINVFVVSIMFSSVALGWYTLAMATGELLWQVSRSFTWPVLGRISLYSLADSAALVARLTRNIFAVVGSLGLIVFIFGPWLIVHVYGQAFQPAGNALRWALPGLVAYAAEIALTNFIIMQLARPLTMIYIQSTSAIICAGVTIFLAGRFGIVAAAATTSFTYLIVTCILITLFIRSTGVPLNRLLFIQQEDLRYYANVVGKFFHVFKVRMS